MCMHMHTSIKPGLHCCKNASRSARNASGDTPSFSTPRHFPISPQMSLCRPVHRSPPEATLFEAIF